MAAFNFYMVSNEMPGEKVAAEGVYAGHAMRFAANMTEMQVEKS